MSDLLALIQACKKSPDVDSLRLILCDWLEEYGDPERAEFIRLQCQKDHPIPYATYRLSGFGCHGPWRLSEEPPRAGGPYDEQKLQREDALLQRNRNRWLGAPDAGPFVECFFRGFLTVENGRGLVQWLSDRSAEQIAWIDSLRVSFDSRGGATLRQLSQGPLLPGLVRLSLGAGDLHPEDIGQQDDPLPRDEIRALLAAPDLPVLRRLSFANYAFTPDDIAALVAAPWFGRLTDLSLAIGWAGRSLCRYLAVRKEPTALVSLRIKDASQGLDDAAVEALCGAACLTELRELDLSGNHFISDGGLQALAASPLLGRLRYLGLRPYGLSGRGDGSQYPPLITPQGIASLQHSASATGLRVVR